jgi:hypothetical protein
MAALSDKPIYVFARGDQIIADTFEVIRIGMGVGDEEFRRHPHCWTNINVNSPRQLDVPMSMGIIAFARAGQVCIMTPFTLAGAMAPVSLAGALLLQHVEVLASVTLAQTVRPGAPVVYGAFTSNVDMRSGSPAFGTPEAFKGAIASGQLARHIGLPLRSSGSSSSNVEDAQAGYETMMNTSGALFGGANVVMHAAGWQEGGLCASFEKFVLDVEMLQMFAESFAPLDATEPELAYDAIAEVAPGGHFFGSSHTLDRYDRAFYEPLVFSRQNVGQWIDEGSTTASTRAHRVGAGNARSVRAAADRRRDHRRARRLRRPPHRRGWRAARLIRLVQSAPIDQGWARVVRPVARRTRPSTRGGAPRERRRRDQASASDASGTRKSISTTEPGARATAWSTPGGIGCASPACSSRSVGTALCIVKCTEPSITRSLPHVPAATRWFRLSPAGKLRSSNGPTVRTRIMSAGSSARSHSAQSIFLPMCSARPVAVSTHG